MDKKLIKVKFMCSHFAYFLQLFAVFCCVSTTFCVLALLMALTDDGVLLIL